MELGEGELDKGSQMVQTSSYKINTRNVMFNMINTINTAASLVAQLVKNLPAMRETCGLISGLGRSPGEGKGYPLQYPGLENSTDCIVHGVGHD